MRHLIRDAIFRRLLAGILMLLLATAASAQPAVPSEKPVDAPRVDTAQVVVNGEVLFKVYGITAFPARQRAASIASRIEGLASDKAFDPASLASVAKEDRTLIMAGETLVLSILDEDAALEGVSRQILAEIYVDRIRGVIQRYRNDRQPDVLLKAVLYVGAATVILGALLYGVIVLFRRINGLLERRFRQRIEQLEVKSMRIVQAHQVWTALAAGVRVIRTLLILALFYVYLNSVLGLFPWTRWLARDLLNYVLDPLLVMGSAFVAYLPKLFFLIILVIVARFLLKLIRVFFDSIAEGRVHFPNFEQEWAWPTYRIVRFVFLAFTLVIAYPYIPGSDSDAFKGVSLFLGVLFSLGSSSVLSNVIAGYSMTYRRAFKVGDRVRIDQTFGDVVEMSVLVTHVLTPKNERVVIPNSKILNNEVINYSAMARDQGLILHTTVGIGYETSWRQVEAMLLMAAERTPGLRPNSQAFVLQKSLGDFAVNYELNVYSDDAHSMNRQYTELHRNILDVFNEYGVQIMTPAYEGDTPEPKVVPRDQWYAAPAQPPAAK
ncbi:MAG: mechanosensitive ion channel family protein [Betaproteobacteria bacterium]|nr:MAG: mechanosensitive ion channel family protein [Betaproteobacteria bacterium]